MNIAYFGSPDISAELLKLLLKQNCPISLVVTQPDKAVGKRLQMSQTPVKRLANEYHIPLFDLQMNNTNETALIPLLQKQSINLGIVFAYGELLSGNLLKSLEYGFWNVHPSLLPRYRGPAPTTFPLLLGDTQTGVTLIQMNTFLDRGDIIQQTVVPISQNDNRRTIEERLIPLAAKDISNALAKLKAKSLKTKQQDNSSATYTRLLHKNDGYISYELVCKALGSKKISSRELPFILTSYFQKNNLLTEHTYTACDVVYNLYRGLSPWPGIWTKVPIHGREKRLKLLSMSPTDIELRLEQVQLEGKTPVDFSTFTQAYNLFLS